MILAEIIPEVFFRDYCSDLVLWLFGAAGIALLVFGADRLVTSAAKLAAAIGMSKVIIGATIVSLGTTSPEAAVSVNAAFQGDGGMALGNAVGSIICNTALIFGMGCCLTRLPKDRFVLNRHGWLQLASGALLTVTALVLLVVGGSIVNVVIPRVAGIGFLLLLVGYIYVSVRWARRHPQIVPPEAGVEMKFNHHSARIAGNLLVMLVGLALVVGGSEVLVGSAKEVCRRFQVPEAVIAATVVAFGTSLPELATAIAAIIKKHPDLLVGNIIGANILNVLFVIGASATAVPLKVEPIFFYFLLPVMMLVLIMFRLYIFADGKTFRRWQGVPLVAIYIAYVAALAFFGTRLG